MSDKWNGGRERPPIGIECEAWLTPPNEWHRVQVIGYDGLSTIARWTTGPKKGALLDYTATRWFRPIPEKIDSPHSPRWKNTVQRWIMLIDAMQNNASASLNGEANRVKKEMVQYLKHGGETAHHRRRIEELEAELEFEEGERKAFVRELEELEQSVIDFAEKVKEKPGRLHSSRETRRESIIAFANSILETHHNEH